MISNFYGINSLLNYAKNFSVSRTLYISSSEVYGKNKITNHIVKKIMGMLIYLILERVTHPLKEQRKHVLKLQKGVRHRCSYSRPGHIYGPTMKITIQGLLLNLQEM
jgi:nucleoside-diphosphate-sugar epimerase